MAAGGARSGAGRKGSFTVEKGREIVERIAEHKRRPEVAAAECGITPDVFRGWLVKARTGNDQDLVEFSNEVSRARLLAEGGMLDTVLEGDEPGYNRAKLHLEILGRTNKHYSQKVQVGIQHELERILDVVARICSPEDFERILADIAALDSEGETGEDQGDQTAVH